MWRRSAAAWPSAATLIRTAGGPGRLIRTAGVRDAGGEEDRRAGRAPLLPDASARTGNHAALEAIRPTWDALYQNGRKPHDDVEAMEGAR